MGCARRGELNNKATADISHVGGHPLLEQFIAASKFRLLTFFGSKSSQLVATKRLERCRMYVERFNAGGGNLGPKMVNVFQPFLFIPRHYRFFVFALLDGFLAIFSHPVIHSPPSSFDIQRFNPTHTHSDTNAARTLTHNCTYQRVRDVGVAPGRGGG